MHDRCVPSVILSVMWTRTDTLRWSRATKMHHPIDEINKFRFSSTSGSTSKLDPRVQFTINNRLTERNAVSRRLDCAVCTVCGCKLYTPPVALAVYTFILYSPLISLCTSGVEASTTYHATPGARAESSPLARRGLVGVAGLGTVNSLQIERKRAEFYSPYTSAQTRTSNKRCATATGRPGSVCATHHTLHPRASPPPAGG